MSSVPSSAFATHHTAELICKGWIKCEMRLLGLKPCRGKRQTIPLGTISCFFFAGSGQGHLLNTDCESVVWHMVTVALDTLNMTLSYA